MQRNLKPRVGDYVEVVKECGGGIKVGEQGLVVGDDLKGPGPYGIMFPASNNFNNYNHTPWFCTAPYIKVVYRGR